LSSSNPNFLKLKTRTANSNFWSWLTHQFLGRLKSAIPNLQIYSPKTANPEKLGLGIDNLCRIVFLSLRMNKCLERANGRRFWNSGVFSYAMIPRCWPNSSFVFIVTSIVYGVTIHIPRRLYMTCSLSFTFSLMCELLVKNITMVCLRFVGRSSNHYDLYHQTRDFHYINTTFSFFLIHEANTWGELRKIKWW
jgi:hypothetical protein